MSPLAIRLDRFSKIFQQGEVVKGRVLVDQEEAKSLTLNLLGTVRTCSRSSLNDPKHPKVEQQVVRVRQNLKTFERTEEVSVFPFEIELIPGKSSSNGVEVLPETYHGEKVEVKYFIEVSLSRGYFLAPLKKQTEIIVTLKPALSSCPKIETAQAFRVSQDSATKRLRAENQESIRVTRFELRGRIKSTQCSLKTPLEGEISIYESNKPVESVEVKLMRVEIVRGGRGHERSEVMSLEVVRGDMPSDLAVPFALYFPKCLTCATLRGLTAKITTQWDYRVEFEVNLVIHFANESFTSQPISVDLFRHQWETIE